MRKTALMCLRRDWPNICIIPIFKQIWRHISHNSVRFALTFWFQLSERETDPLTVMKTDHWSWIYSNNRWLFNIPFKNCRQWSTSPPLGRISSRFWILAAPIHPQTCSVSSQRCWMGFRSALCTDLSDSSTKTTNLDARYYLKREFAPLLDRNLNPAQLIATRAKLQSDDILLHNIINCRAVLQRQIRFQTQRSVPRSGFPGL